MFFQNLLPNDIPVMETFIKYKVHQIVSIIYKDYNGYIPRIEAPYLIRYFLQFPSQSQVVDEIIPSIEKNQSPTHEEKELHEVDAFEKYLIQILKTNQYASYDRETLIEAFRVLDSEKNGYLDLHTFYTFLKRYGITFTKEQIDEMEKFLVENDNELLESLGVKNDEPVKPKPTTTRKFYYESYVRKVLGDDLNHFQGIMKEYKDFYNEYLETKKFPDMPVLTVQKEEEKKEEEKKEEEKKEEKKEGEEEKKEGEEEKKEGEEEKKEGEEEKKNEEEEKKDEEKKE